MRKIMTNILCFILMLSLSTALASPANEELINAATLGDSVKVETLLKDGANPNAQNAYGWTPLLAASAGSRLDIAVILMDAGANINVASHMGETPLLYAVMTRNNPLINMFIQRGADPNKRNTMGLSPADVAKTYRINLPSKTSNVSTVSSIPSVSSIPLENTTLVILNNETLKKAKLDSPLVGKYSNDSIEQYAYYVGKKDYGLSYNYSPIGVAVITPYSLSKYGFFKEKQIFLDFSLDDQRLLLENNSTVFVMTFNSIPYNLAPSAPIQNIIIRKNGVVYRTINANTSLITKWGIGGTLWAFPIGLFNSKEEMEIIIIDGHDNVKPLKLSTEKLEKIK